MIKFIVDIKFKVLSKFLLYICLFIAALSLVACSVIKKNSNSNLQKLSVSEFEKINSNSIDASVEDIKIKGDEITFTLSYRGCKDKTFQLYWNGTYSKSIPPQVLISLQSNDTKANNCDETIPQKDITFSIKDLQYKGQKQIQINYQKSSFNYTY